MPRFWPFQRPQKTTPVENNLNQTTTQIHPSSSDIDMLPIGDLRESNRVDFQHYFMRQALAGNYLAPIQQPATILDVGCGTGRWMAEVAQKFPLAAVTSVDVIPLSLKDSAIPFPPNCHFQQCDVLNGLPFLANTFDFVHLRFLSFALPLQTWPPIVQELKRVTRPGGWIELIEPDLRFHNQGPETARLMQWIERSCGSRGLDITIGEKLASFLQKAELVNVAERKVSIPMGSWGGRIGSMLAINYEEAAIVIEPVVTSVMKVSSEEYRRVVAAWQRENNIYRTTCDFYVAYGQCL